MSAPAQSRLSRYLTVIVRWLVIAFVVFVLTLLGGSYIADNLFPKVYTATAQIQEPPRGVIDIFSSSKDGVVNEPPEPADFRSEFEIMESPDVLLPVIKDLGLDKAWAKRIFKSKEDQLSGQDALAYMNKILKLEVVRGTTIINITASSDVPKEAADVANAVADRYKTMRDVEEDQRTNRGEDSLRDQIALQQKVVDDKKAALEKMPQDQSPAFRDAQRDLDQAQNLLDALTVRLRQVMADRQLEESPVRMISRAEAPAKPNNSFTFLVTIIAATLGVLIASFSEVMLLFSRASERTDN